MRWGYNPGFALEFLPWIVSWTRFLWIYYCVFWEKGNVCFSLLVCHIWLFSFFRNPAAKRSVSLPLVTILEGLNICDDPLHNSRFFGSLTFSSVVIFFSLPCLILSCSNSRRSYFKHVSLWPPPPNLPAYLLHNAHSRNCKQSCVISGSVWALDPDCQASNLSI